jgi:hypothetical protein
MQKINKEIIVYTLLSVTVFLLVRVAIPLDFPYIFNFDESIELVRLHLLEKNYVFYQNVWSDHPLGMTRILDFFSTFFSIDLSSARKIVLGLSITNILVFYTLLRIDCSRSIAIATVVMTVLSFGYIGLSGSAVNEIPALLFSLSSILFMSFYSQDKSPKNIVFLVVSAGLFAFSVVVKLSGVSALIPLLIIGISSEKSSSKKNTDGIFWVLIASVSLFIFSFRLFPFSYYHLIEFHAQANEVFSDSPETFLALANKVFRSDFGYVILFLSSFLYLVKSGKLRLAVAPIAWVVFNLVRFSGVSPVWPTYYIHVMIPLFWMVAISAEQVRKKRHCIVEAIKKNHWFSPAIVAVLVITAFLQSSLNLVKVVTASNPRRFQDKQLVYFNNLAKDYVESSIDLYLKTHAKAGYSILSDDPYFIHKYDLETPAETAILSRKRVTTEGIDGDYIADIVERNIPDFVYLSRFQKDFLKSQSLRDILNKYYVTPFDKESSGKLYVKKSL